MKSFLELSDSFNTPQGATPSFVFQIRKFNRQFNLGIIRFNLIGEMYLKRISREAEIALLLVITRRRDTLESSDNFNSISANGQRSEGLVNN